MQLFIAILIISILYGVEVDIFIPSFPEIQKTFALSPFLVQLTLSANYFAYATCALFAGSFGDRFNRRIVILYSLGIFLLGSICCVFANHYSWLIAGRFLQGIGMAGPAVLAYVIVADTYALEKQITLMGILNACVTLAMAFAPVAGSYINLYFGWRSNFIVLLGFGILAFAVSYLFVPNRSGDSSISVSPKSYIPLLSSKKLMIFILALSLEGISYWTFIGMAPILYMDGFGVDIRNFGFYQGSLAFVFGIMSICSPKIIKKYGMKKSLEYSLNACFIISLMTAIIALTKVRSPLIVTLVMSMFGAAVVLPIQILFPIMLQVIANSKGRISALMNSSRLLLTALTLEVVSYFYTGDFLLLGIFIVILMLSSTYMIRHILKNDWIEFD